MVKGSQAVEETQMKMKTLKRLVVTAIKSSSFEAIRPSVPVPVDVELSFRSLRPRYLYREGVRPAFFRDVSIWRETGEYVAFYERTVRTARGDAHEKYAWVLRTGRFIEVRQFGLRDVTHRVFVEG